MKIEYNNLYTHFIFSTLHRLPLISEKHRERIEKYITGIVNNNDSHLYSIYANPEHVHFLVSRSPKLSEEILASMIAESSQQFINQNKLCNNQFSWQSRIFGMPFQYQSRMLIEFVNTFLINRNTTLK
jgi:putative transposase